MFRQLVALGIALAAATSAPAQAPVDPRRSASSSVEQDFAAWLSAFRARAMGEGISAGTLDRTLGGLTFNRRVVELDRAQPDDSRPASVPLFSNYLARQLTDGRVAQGRRIAAEIGPTLQAVEARYGVPAPVVMGIWGMETNYGSFTGNFDLVRSLASLAFDGRREALFTRELIAALKLIDSGAVTRERLVGSWAGATGNPQFLPTSYLEHAVDFDGDGKPDIWASRADTAASIANYLKNAGWQAGGDWAMKVFVPQGLDRGRVRNLVEPKECPRVLAKHSRWIPVAEWKALGLQPLDGKRWPADNVLAALVEPDGEGQGGYLTYGNYRALLDYNCSNFYALSVGLLADAIGAAAGASAAGAAAGGVRDGAATAGR